MNVMAQHTSVDGQQFRIVHCVVPVSRATEVSRVWTYQTGIGRLGNGTMVDEGERSLLASAVSMWAGREVRRDISIAWIKDRTASGEPGTDLGKGSGGVLWIARGHDAEVFF